MRMIVTLSSKGQLTLPASLREKLGLEQGSRVELVLDETDQAVRLRRMPEIDELTARISSYAKGAPVLNVDEYYQTHREAR
jgi:AbrB family looped-hinge helix DNA binding protein